MGVAGDLCKIAVTGFDPPAVHQIKRAAQSDTALLSQSKLELGCDETKRC